jgi:hypothetical protein
MSSILNDGDVLLPWDGEDELTGAKTAPEKAGKTQSAPVVSPVVPLAPPDGLPEIGAFVRSLGRVNSTMVFKDLVQSGHLFRKAGKYMQNPKKAGKARWFLQPVKEGKHALLVTEEGQALLRQLKRDGTLTKAKTKVPLTARQKELRETKRALKAQQKAEKAAALVASQPEVLANLDATIEASIAKRADRKRRMSASSKAVMDRFYQTQQQEVMSE